MSSATALVQTAAELVAGSRGILAADESTKTMSGRLQQHHISSTESTRRDWRELLITSRAISAAISGVILYDETAHQLTKGGERFPEAISARGMIPGIKVDQGTVPLTGHEDEKITEGLDGLAHRLAAYRLLGLRFAKWRATFTIDARHGLPSDAAIEHNAARLARYALACQEEYFVPIVEPEVLMHGSHTLEQCGEHTRRVLAALFTHLEDRGVDLASALLKANMILPGDQAPVQNDDQAVAQATLVCLHATVPTRLAGIAFLSGGQTADQATSRLAAINGQGSQPWPLTFSYGRALQQDALAHWAGDPTRAAKAQAIFKRRAQAISNARQPAPTAAP